MTFSIVTLMALKRKVELDDPRVTLIDLLRERLDLTGAKRAVNAHAAPATVLVTAGGSIRARRWRSAWMAAEGRTVEGIAKDDSHQVQSAFHRHDALQCGFCTPASS